MSSREVLPAASTTGTAGLFPSWFPSVVLRINELIHRPEDWDSYGAHALREDAAASLFEALLNLGPFIQAAPTISLNEKGGLVAEWSSSQSDLELLADPGSEIEIYYHEHASGREWELPAHQASALEKWLWQASASL